MSLANLTGSPPGNVLSGRTPVGRILVNNEILDVTAREMTLNRAEGQHDTATLALSSTTLTDTEDLLEKPISFVFGLSPRTEFWYGYITKVSEETVDNVNLHFTLNLYGTTIHLQKGHPRFWANKTAPGVVRDLVAASALGVIGSDHPLAWKALAQTEESDWQIVSAMAKRIGYCIFTWNGIVLCEDPMLLYSSNGPYVRLVAEDSPNITNQRQLLEFTPTRDSTQTFDGMGLTFAFLGSGGQVVRSSQTGYKSYRFISQLLVRNQEEADSYIASVDRDISNWHQLATARIDGDATLYPGVCVEIVTANSGIADRKYDGKWLIRSIKHTMNNQTFQSMLTMARPDQTAYTQVLPFRHFWEADNRGKPTMWIRDAGSNGTLRPEWMSSWSDSRAKAAVQ